MAHNDSDSNKKEEKLYNFLCKAMDDYDKVKIYMKSQYFQ